jgi:hypothetical protein
MLKIAPMPLLRMERKRGGEVMVAYISPWDTSLQIVYFLLLLSDVVPVSIT